VDRSDLPKVAPSVAVVGRDAAEENIGVLDSAEVAVGHGLGVGHLTTGRCFPGLNVLTAVFAFARVKVDQLVLRALHIGVG